MSVFGENHNFTLTEYHGYGNWNALSVAAATGHFNLVNRLLEIDVVIDNAAKVLKGDVKKCDIDLAYLDSELDKLIDNASDEDNYAFDRNVANIGYCQAVYALARVQMPSVRYNLLPYNIYD